MPRFRVTNTYSPASLFWAESGGTICWPLGEKNDSIVTVLDGESHVILTDVFAGEFAGMALLVIRRGETEVKR